MKFLQELVRFNRLDDESATDDDTSDIDQPDGEYEGIPTEPNDDSLGDDTPTDNTSMVDEVEPSEPEDPNRQGLIRTVKGAHLVYKREVEDGTYAELWQYGISTLRDEINIRKAILAGTDIPVNKAQSPDGSQSFETWAAGNAELLLVTGLPS